MSIETRLFAVKWHGDQLYGDAHYVEHLDHVQSKVCFLYSNDSDRSLLERVALLHDLFEDTECSEQELREHLSQIEFVEVDRIIDAIHAITKKENESRHDYLLRCARNKDALKVKIADTICNLECSVRSKEVIRITKYTKQINFLFELVSP